MFWKIAIFMVTQSLVLNAGDLLKLIKQPDYVWSRQKLAIELYKECRIDDNKCKNIEEILKWNKLLTSNKAIMVNDDLSQKIQIREIALTCIEELSGEIFYPFKNKYCATREIVTTSVDNETERFVIPEINPSDVDGILENVSAWLKERKKPTKGN